MWSFLENLLFSILPIYNEITSGNYYFYKLIKVFKIRTTLLVKKRPLCCVVSCPENGQISSITITYVTFHTLISSSSYWEHTQLFKIVGHETFNKVRQCVSGALVENRIPGWLKVESNSDINQFPNNHAGERWQTWRNFRLFWEFGTERCLK